MVSRILGLIKKPGDKSPKVASLADGSSAKEMPSAFVTMDSPVDGDGPMPSAAVIGAGYLGARIITELLLLGSDVAVYDRSLVQKGAAAGQTELDRVVAMLVHECQQQGLTQEAGMLPHVGMGVYAPYDENRPRRARLCTTVKEAVLKAHIVVEAVPDHLAIKQDVFSEALSSAPEGVLLATSTLSLSLAKIQDAIKKPGAPPPRVVGLRFLAPVLFIPFVEITLTSKQVHGVQQDHRDALIGVITRWGKSCFVCDLEGAAEGDEGDGINECLRRSAARLRLDTAIAQRRQKGEARLRRAYRDGPEAIAALTSADLYDFGGEDRCCICLDNEPVVSSLLCGHCVLCPSCADHVDLFQKRCPVCRVRFARAVHSKASE